MKLRRSWNVWFFGCNIRGEIGFQNLQKFWVAKALMSSYIFCKILKFSNPSHKRYSIHRALIPWSNSSCCALSIFRTDVFVAPSKSVPLILITKQRFASLFIVACFERTYVWYFAVVNVFVCCGCLGIGLSHLKTFGSVNCSQRSQNSQHPENSHHRKLRVPEKTQQTHNVVKTRYHATKQQALTLFRSDLKRQIS